MVASLLLAFTALYAQAVFEARVFAGSLPAVEGELGLDAVLSNPGAMAMDSDGSLYLSDVSPNRVRRLAPDGSLSTVADIAGAHVGFADGLLYVGSGSVLTAIDRDGKRTFLSPTSTYRLGFSLGFPPGLAH